MADVKVHGWVTIDDNFEQMVICAARYAIGRQSYLPTDIIAYIRYLKPQLSINSLYVLYTDIAEKINDCTRMNRDMPYGDEWAQLALELKKEQEKKAVKL